MDNMYFISYLPQINDGSSVRLIDVPQKQRAKCRHIDHLAKAAGNAVGPAHHPFVQIGQRLAQEPASCM